MNKTVKTVLWLLVLVGFGYAMYNFGASSSYAETPFGTETAEATVEKVLGDLRNGKTQTVWAALPKSYQDDLNGVVRSFAGKMDEDIWDKGFALIQKSSKVLRAKKDFFMAHPTNARRLAKARKNTDASFNSMLSAGDLLTRSDIATVDGMKNFDGGKFSSQVGDQLFEAFMELVATFPGDNELPDFKGTLAMKVETVSEVGDRATLRLTTAGEKPKDHEFVRIEGRWIPEEMAHNWHSLMSELRAKVDDFSGEELKAKKMQIIALIGMADAMLDQLKKVKTQDEFNVLWDGFQSVEKQMARNGVPWMSSD